MLNKWIAMTRMKKNMFFKQWKFFVTNKNLESLQTTIDFEKEHIDWIRRCILRNKAWLKIGWNAWVGPSRYQCTRSYKIHRSSPENKRSGQTTENHSLISWSVINWFFRAAFIDTERRSWLWKSTSERQLIIALYPTKNKWYLYACQYLIAHDTRGKTLFSRISKFT